MNLEWLRLIGTRNLVGVVYLHASISRGHIIFVLVRRFFGFLSEKLVQRLLGIFGGVVVPAILMLTAFVNHVAVRFHAVMVHDVVRFSARQVMPNVRHQVQMVGMLHRLASVHLRRMRSIGMMSDG
jgi:hypothetical protein